MAEEELLVLKERMADYVSKVPTEFDIDMEYLILTNVYTESSLVLFAGKNSVNVLKTAFNMNNDNHSCFICIMLRN